MHSRNEYLKLLRGKSLILDEYCQNTSQARKYVIRKIQPGVNLGPKLREKRKESYDGPVKVALAKMKNDNAYIKQKN